jgi:hypothetical protein
MYVFQYGKKNNDVTHLDVDGVFLINPMILLRPSPNIFNRSIIVVVLVSMPFFVKHCTENLPLHFISDSDVQKAIKWLRPTKLVALDGIPSFVIKGCSEIFVPILRFIFNLNLSQNTSPKLWKQAVIVPVFKMDDFLCYKLSAHYNSQYSFPNYLNLLYMTIFTIFSNLK